MARRARAASAPSHVADVLGLRAMVLLPRYVVVGSGYRGIMPKRRHSVTTGRRGPAPTIGAGDRHHRYQQEQRLGVHAGEEEGERENRQIQDGPPRRHARLPSQSSASRYNANIEDPIIGLLSR